MSRIFVAILAQDPYLAAPVLPTSAQKVRQKHVTGTLDLEIRGGPLHIYLLFDLSYKSASIIETTD